MLDVRAIVWLENYLQVSLGKAFQWVWRTAASETLWGHLPFQTACHPVIPQTWPSTILVVSHDRNFLNAIATDIIHLHSQRLDGYRGDFETFIKSKQERLLNQQREYEAQQQYRQHIQVCGGGRTLGTSP